METYKSFPFGLIKRIPQRLFLKVSLSKFIVIIISLHIFGSLGTASLRPGYNGDATFNAFTPYSAATELSFPFINTNPDWEWQTEIAVQNTVATNNTISLKYFDFAGNLIANPSAQLGPFASQVFSPPANFSGSLVVTGSQPLAAIALGSNSAPANLGDKLISYKGTPTLTVSLNSKIIMYPPTPYAPYEIRLIPIQKNHNGYNSILAVQNQEGSGTASISMTFRNLADGATTTITDTLPAYSSKFYDISGLTNLGVSFNGSVDIIADKIVTGAAITYSPLSGGGAVSFNPIWADPEILFSDKNLSLSGTFLGGSIITQSSNITILNLSTTSIGNYLIDFYDVNGNQYLNNSSFTIPAGGYYVFPVSGYMPQGVTGSAMVASDQQSASLVTTDWSNTPLTSTGLLGVTSPATSAYIPFVIKKNLDTITQIVVQNTSVSPSNVTVTFYNESGMVAGSQSASISYNGYHIFDQASAAFLQDGFKGSAIISSDLPIAAVGFISRSISSSFSGKIFLPIILKGYYSSPYNQTTPPTHITPTSAEFGGTLFPITTMTYYFQWGLSPAYGYTTPVQTIGPSLVPINVYYYIVQLTPGTTYYYRLVYYYGGSYYYGSPQSFTTSGYIPHNPFQIDCESSEYTYGQCPSSVGIDSVRVASQLSTADCIQGDTWGFTHDYIWVDKGCRAIFDVNYAYAFQIDCESSEYRYGQCSSSVPIYSLWLGSQISTAACIQNQTYGFTSSYVWVDQGCRGIFNIN